jgi:hypothetical protein
MSTLDRIELSYVAMKLSLGNRCIVTRFVSETLTSCRDLEDVIERFTTQTEGNLDYVICPRDDCMLLNCRLPAVHVESKLGIVECFEDDCGVTLIDPSLRIFFFHGLNQSPCADDFNKHPDPPHGLWTRFKRSANSSSNENDLKVMWIDLRDIHFELRSSSECCHFLRSLLGSSHHASPWRETDDDAITCSTIAIITNTSCEVLECFRTTDACPSYFLHSISRLEIPIHEPQWWIRSKTPVKPSLEKATLLI